MGKLFETHRLLSTMLSMLALTFVLIEVTYSSEANAQSYDWNSTSYDWNSSVYNWTPPAYENLFFIEEPEPLTSFELPPVPEPFDYWDTPSGKRFLREEERGYRIRQEIRQAERGHWMNFCNVTTHIQHLREQCYASW